MTDKSNSSNASDTIDLDSLKDLNFGPSWSDEKSNSSKRLSSNTKLIDKKQSKPRKSFSAAKKDRRIDNGIRSNKSGTHFKKNNKSDYLFKKEDNSGIELNIYPQDETFDALVKQLKNDNKTYQLFEITKIILEKPERFVILIDKGNNASDNESKSIYFTLKDKIPFDTKEEAVSHFSNNFLCDYFEIQEVQLESPKGDFKMVYKCPFTETLLGPPNYHKFQDILKEHHNSFVKNLSIDEYQNKLLCEKDEESVNKWLDDMKKGNKYKLLDSEHFKESNNVNEGDSSKNSDVSEVILDSKSDAINYLLKNNPETIIKTSSSFRFSGTKLNELPEGKIKSAILQEIDNQRRFPLNSANNIRGRLRRHKFSIYKKGSKGVSYVCAVKRKFRDSTTVFTDSIGDIIRFIEHNQNINFQHMPFSYLGIDSPSKTKKINKGDDSSTEKSTDHDGNISDITDENKTKIKEIIKNVRWLISEGYVTEYSNGALYVHPIIETKQNSIIKESDVIEDNGIDATDNRDDSSEV